MKSRLQRRSVRLTDRTSTSSMLNTVANEPCRAMNVELPLAWIESILAYAVPSLQARKRVVGLGIGTRHESAVLAPYVWFRRIFQPLAALPEK